MTLVHSSEPLDFIISPINNLPNISDPIQHCANGSILVNPLRDTINSKNIF